MKHRDLGLSRSWAVILLSLGVSGCVSEQQFTGGSQTETLTLLDSAGSGPVGENPESTPPESQPPENKPPENPSGKPTCGHEKDVTDLIAEFEARCRKNFENRETQDVSDFDYTLVRQSGNFLLKGVRFDLLDLVSGNLFFHSSLPAPAKAPVLKIQGGTGSFFFCDANVDLVDGFKGNLHIVRGSVREIRNTTGNVTIISGNVGSRSNSRGTLRVIAGNVGLIQGSSGNVRVDAGNIGDIRYSNGNITIRNGSHTGILEAFRGNLVKSKPGFGI